jgi:bile acid-coenzyme A ligase
MSETTFGLALRRLAEAEPDRPALTCGGVTLSRRQFLERFERLATLFAELGVRAGSTVTIGLPNSIGFLESTFAAWELGAVPQAISHRLSAAERSAIIELADPALTVGLPQSEVGGRPMLESVPEDLSASLPRTEDPPVSPVWKIMTSGGSTGRPKLIVANQPALVENVAGFGRLLHFPEAGCVLVTGPMSHNAPFVVATIGLLCGNHVVVMPRFDAAQSLQLVEDYRVQWLYLVPTMMLRIWRLPEAVRRSADLSSLRVAFHMASPCPAWLKLAWIEWLGPETVLELYGGTELQAMTVIGGAEWMEHRGSVGRPVIGEIDVRDPDGVSVLPLEIGEIWMRRGARAPSPYAYIGATPKRAQDGWESLGDIGFRDADGYLYITDRLADMILVGGSNIYPAEIEAALDEHPAMQSCCVIGLPDEDLGNVPHAIVHLSEPVSDEDLLAYLRTRLAPYKLPRSFERTSEPLRDDAGKIRRSALRAERLTQNTSP